MLSVDERGMGERVLELERELKEVWLVVVEGEKTEAPRALFEEKLGRRLREALPQKLGLLRPRIEGWGLEREEKPRRTRHRWFPWASRSSKRVSSLP